jgi:hypothetical protein
MADIQAVPRDELAKFLPSQRAIRAFELIFELLVPAGDASLIVRIEEVSQQAASGVSAAQEAIDAINRLSDSLELLAGAMRIEPEPQDAEVLPPEPGPLLAECGDVSIPTPANNNVLTYNGTTATWQASSSVTGSLTDTTTNLIASSVALGNGAAAAAGTLGNAPTAGNPTKWVPINDNGTTRYIPTWT